MDDLFRLYVIAGLITLGLGVIAVGRRPEIAASYANRSGIAALMLILFLWPAFWIWLAIKAYERSKR